MVVMRVRFPSPAPQDYNSADGAVFLFQITIQQSIIPLSHGCFIIVSKVLKIK